MKERTNLSQCSAGRSTESLKNSRNITADVAPGRRSESTDSEYKSRERCDLGEVHGLQVANLRGIWKSWGLFIPVNGITESRQKPVCIAVVVG